MEKAIAIIPARGGSKRIPRKNIKQFCGKPIINYSIKAALESNCFSTVMVSTDDEEIASFARKGGADVPFMRSAETANDLASVEDVITEVLAKYRASNHLFDSFCCILATAPFLTGNAISRSYTSFKSSGADGLFSVVRYSYPIQRALRIQNDRLSMIAPEHMYSRSNDLEPAYHDAGQFYWMKTQAFDKERLLFSKNAAPYELSESTVQDIDTEEDWSIAEIKYKIQTAVVQ